MAWGQAQLHGDLAGTGHSVMGINEEVRVGYILQSEFGKELV